MTLLGKDVIITKVQGKEIRIGEYIRKKRQALGWSRVELAARCGLSQSYVRYLEQGERKPKIETLQKVAKGLGVSFEEIAKVAGVPTTRLYRVPIVSWASAGHWKEVPDIIPEEWIEVDVDRPNLFALRVQGDSMEPEFKQGEIIVVDADAAWDSGDFVLVRNEGEVTFKQIKKYRDVWVLRSLNPNYQDIEMTQDHVIVGRVIRKVKKY